MDEQMIELLPCPFCGSANVIMVASNGVPHGEALAGGTRHVECDDCCACGPAEPPQRDGRAWNHRAAHSVIAGKVDELEGRIEAVRKVVEEGYPGQPAKTEQCEHGRYGWEDCVACYDAAILAALAPYPERRSE